MKRVQRLSFGWRLETGTEATYRRLLPSGNGRRRVVANCHRRTSLRSKSFIVALYLGVVVAIVGTLLVLAPSTSRIDQIKRSVLKTERKWDKDNPHRYL